ncbi:MAG TPA: glycosyltransferase family 2 protein [Ramlibacter sp.]|jgi:glycosyltransferase involved in cell wall biosynthesis|nr:glycosyltransferase family 2 protein [Ramlibacter sp.]
MSRPSQPLVSVCVPTYKRADRLRSALDKILHCSYANLEVIVSDNASPDHTPQVCEELARTDARVRYYRHPVNQGATKNFEFARAQATGKYFLWHADDDHLDPDYIERCVAELEADPSLVLVAGVAAYHRGDHVTTFRGNVMQPAWRSGIARALHYVFFMEDNSIFCGLYRRESVSDCHPPVCLAGDSVFVAEVLLHGRGKVLPEIHVYREASDGLSASPKSMVAAVGGPAWQGDYPWLAVPANMARGIAFGSWKYRDSNALLQATVYATVFLVSFTKQAILMVMGKLPFGNRLYKKLFSSEMGLT